MPTVNKYYHLEAYTYELRQTRAFHPSDSQGDLNHKWNNVFIINGTVHISTDLASTLINGFRASSYYPSYTLGRKQIFSLESLLDDIIHHYEYHKRSQEQFGMKPSAREAYTADRNRKITEWLIEQAS